MKILETIHSKKRYYLVFDDMEIVGKFETIEEAKQYINENKQDRTPTTTR